MKRQKGRVYERCHGIYVRWVNMNLLHRNAKFSHLCDPNRHSINRQFRPAASHLSSPPSTQNDPLLWKSLAYKAQKATFGSGGSKYVLMLTSVYFFLNEIDRNQQLSDVHWQFNVPQVMENSSRNMLGHAPILYIDGSLTKLKAAGCQRADIDL